MGNGSFPRPYAKRELAPCDVSLAIGSLEMVSKAPKGPSYRALGAALGLSHTMARKLHEKQGMPTDSIEAATAWYALNGHRRGGGHLGTRAVGSFQRMAPAAPVSRVAPITLPLTLEVPQGLLDQGTLNRMLTAERVRVTQLEAEQAKVDGQIRDGHLVQAEEVKRIGMARAIALRDRLLALPAELAIQLAAITDPALVSDLLRKRLKAALTEFCAAHGATAETR